MSSRPNFALAGEAPQHFGVEASLTYIWDVPTLSWVKSTGSGGGGGGAATIADGADVAEGTTTDVAWVSGAGTVISLLKKIASAGGSAVSIADGADLVEGALADAAIITDTTGTVNGKLRGLVKHAYERMPAALGQTTMAASLPVTLASNQSGLAVTGTFFQATQPVSAAALPLPAGASTSALQTQPGVDIGDVTVNNGAAGAAVNVQDGGNSITVDGTVTTTPPANASSNVTQWAGTAVSLNTGVRDAGTLRVTVATNDSVPVTGTVTTTPPANASTNVAQIAGTATDVNSGTKSAGTIRVVLATDQPALTNKLLVTPDSVALPANQSVNAAQLAGTTTDTNSGLKSAGTLRVVLATDQPALTNKLLVTPDSVALPANQSTNVNQFGGSAVVTGTGVGGAGIPRVTVSSDSALATVTTVTAVTAITNALPTGANIIGSVNGDVDHDAVNTLKQIQVAGNARAVDDPPTAVSAVGDRVRVWYDRYGSPVVRRRKIRESYTAVARLAEAAARLDQTFTQVANTNKQWSTLHHAATATKEIRLQRCWVYITSDTVAGIQGVVELRELSVTTPPATGNPAITPRAHRIGTGAAEATCLYLPTTQGSEAAVNSPLGHVPFDTGISGPVSVVNPVPILVPVVLWDANADDDEVINATAPVGVYGGWAVMVRTVGAPVLRITVVWRFTEEIP